MNIQVYEAVRTKNLQSVNILCTYSVVNCLTHTQKKNPTGIVWTATREKCEHTKANSPKPQPSLKNPQSIELHVSSPDKK